MHRDVKPHNLLISGFGQVKVCDFGIAAVVRDAVAGDRTNAITLTYASPEEIDNIGEVGSPADVYSLALTMLQLTVGRRPTFQDRVDPTATMTLAAAGRQAGALPMFKAMGECLAHEPAARPTMSDLAVVFEEASFALGGRRLQRLAVPRVKATEDEASEDVTIVRSAPPAAPAAAPPSGGGDAPRTAPPATPAPQPQPQNSPPQAGWYTDPSGRHQQRYWSGNQWTDHVADNRVASTDPINAASWYRDPSGRHQLRYWNGNQWTDHVADNGRLQSDPPTHR